MFALVPREVAFLDMFQNAARNMIEGSRLLKGLMADYQNPVRRQARSNTSNTWGMRSPTTSSGG